MFWKLGLVGTFGIFLIVGGLLLTGHHGFAIRVANHAFFLLLGVILWGYLANEA